MLQTTCQLFTKSYEIYVIFLALAGQSKNWRIQGPAPGIPEFLSTGSAASWSLGEVRSRQHCRTVANAAGVSLCQPARDALVMEPRWEFFYPEMLYLKFSFISSGLAHSILWRIALCFQSDQSLPLSDSNKLQLLKQTDIKIEKLSDALVGCGKYVCTAHMTWSKNKWMEYVIYNQHISNNIV